MRDRQNARDAQTLSRLRSLQKAAEQQTLLDARATAEARSQDVENAKLEVDEAVAFWMNSAGNGAVVDPAQLGLASAVLTQSEGRLSAAHELQHQADETAEIQRQRVSESVVRLGQAQETERVLGRRLQHRLEERRLSTIEDRIAFDWRPRG
ncbi:MAG TPA: hypothetical protein VGO52_06220 [Hyphomonadaceae bacterium]|jgi:hypothetical protein|nr:hypothetical protein [Hyphomonadaceae bacterium]